MIIAGAITAIVGGVNSNVWSGIYSRTLIDLLCVQSREQSTGNLL